MIKLKSLIKEKFDVDTHTGNDDINDLHRSILLKNLDTFTKAYITGALFTETDNLEPNGGEPLDKKYTIEDIDPSTIKQMEKDCKDFQSKYSELYESGGWNDDTAAFDFWLTRNGHGSGFWDRNWYDNTNEVGKQLSKFAKSYGGYHLYLGDGQYDGVIFGTKG